MSVDLNVFSKEVHQNAVKHGWWDDKQSYAGQIALIHSEWSEALEEYRANRQMVWFMCREIVNSPQICNPEDDSDCRFYKTRETCIHRGKKPEGIAVELIDGVIRILDLAGAHDEDFDAEKTVWDLISELDEDWKNRSKESLPDLPEFIAILHALTSEAYEMGRKNGIRTLLEVVSMVIIWLKVNGVDWEKVMMQKHEYNKTRPYKHGGKIC